jgi:UDP-N-acetylmuramoyl-L-alanyl-D-glutamate--2,6-diaminopimelate ligase
MGKVASKLADYNYITNDDPYSEEPEVIAGAVESGFKNTGKTNYEIILDRTAAIRKAIQTAKDGDVIIVAGMGHQKVQVFRDKTVSYNDKETILKIMNERTKE